MIILWTVNILFPEAQSLMDVKSRDLASSGGWLIGAADSLTTRDDIELHVACPARVSEVLVLQGEKICYHLFPGLQPSGEPYYGDVPDLDAVFRGLIDGIKPDLIDIHGTEYAHSFSCLRAAGEIPCVITIQGFLHACALHYHDGLSRWTILSHKRLFKKGILEEEESFRKRGEVEQTLLSRARHFIGRTEWDQSCIRNCNPIASYHVCNETLRNAFYDGRWSWDACEKHSIFISQGSYPLKGLHQMLKALPGIVRRYPDTVLYVGGGNITEGRRRNLSNYGRILTSLIRRNHLRGHVCFTGELDTLAMKERFLKSNLFVCPSSVENSSNSLAEAQILGVPCVASRRGGTPTLIPDEQMGLLYDFDDTKALERAVCQVFESSPTWDNTAMRERARSRHDKTSNSEALVEIYRKVTGLS